MSIKHALNKYPNMLGVIAIFVLVVTLSMAQAGIALTSNIAINSGSSITPNPIVLAPLKPIKFLEVRVNGSLVLLNGDSINEKTSALKHIRLPEAEVYLKNSGGAAVAKGLTQLDGKFNLSAPAAGSYQLCWKVVNLTAGCTKPFKVGSNTVYLQKVLVSSTRSYVYGMSRLKEDRPCWLHDPFFGVNLFTKIDLLDTKNNIVGTGGKANTAGEYVIGLPKGDRYRVRSSCEKTVFETQQYFPAGTISHADLPLDNYVPKSVGLAAFKSGKGITRADPGSFISSRLTARDADNDPLDFRWKVIDGSGTLSNVNSDSQDWTLPTDAGMQRIYVMAKDGRGGYAIERLNMTVGPPELNFSGLVIDEVTRLPVVNAHVEVTGVKTMTNAKGWFELVVPEFSGDQRYPLNISHTHFATYSRVLDKSSRGNTYELIRAQVTYHDPNKPIDVIDVSSSGPCGRVDGVLMDRQKAKAIDQTSTVNRKCEHRGARLKLPAASLVYPDQSPAIGPVSLAMATLNPARRALPGDYRAIDANGKDMELVSFGALFASFRDANGKEVNLKQGMEASLEIPISNDQLPIAKATIPMWTYQKKTGLWQEEGAGKFAYTPLGYMYQGTTKHFSTINMDVAGNDPNFATCVRLEQDESLSAWSNLVLRAYVTAAGSTSSQVKETALDSSQYHAIYRIPYSNPPAGNTLRLELRGELPSGAEVVLLDDIINTDARPKMTGNDLWPPYPYDACGEPIILSADPVDLPYYGDIDATGRPAFLTGPYGQYLPENAVQTSTDYYAAIDPADDKLTLGDWWVENGFGADGSGGTRASYLNHNDLGFGRDMHCLGDSSDYACYVTNYGLPDQNPANANDAAGTPPNTATQGATVTMEYHASAGVNAVSFYAYGGGVAGSPRVNFADLDGLGPKPLPHLCMVCHGSNSAALDSNNLVVGAKFREFDLPSLRYSNDRSWDYGIAPDVSGILTLSPGEFAVFHTLNSEVAAINPGNKIQELINAWYPGAADVPVLPATPSNWAVLPPTPAETSLYYDVYAKTCRTCHIARGYPDTHDQFVNSSSVVCGQPRTMPNAFITYKNFWSDLIRVDEYETAIGNPDCNQ